MTTKMILNSQILLTLVQDQESQLAFKYATIYYCHRQMHITIS